MNIDDGLLGISSSIETLPPAYFDSANLYSAGFQTPPLKTITETSTKTTQRLKTNILPIVVDGVPSYRTLTQTYNVKILVEATKTLPYEITPSKTFQDVQQEKEKVAADLLRQLLPGIFEDIAFSFSTFKYFQNACLFSSYSFIFSQ